MIIWSTLHENLINLLTGRITSGHLTPMEREIQTVIDMRGKWKWDTFSFETGVISDNVKPLDKVEMKAALKKYPGNLSAKMVEVIDSESYTFDAYISETANDVLKCLRDLILEGE